MARPPINRNALSAAAPSAESVNGDAQLILAARLYYIDGLSQAQIAKMAGVSQAKVSRLLSLARERGIVRISVPDYNPRDVALEDAVRDQFGLKEVIVARRLESQSIVDLRSSMGYFAGPIVSRWITSSTTLAVAGGRTLRCLAERMRPEGSARDVTVVQAMGNIDESPGTYDAIDIGRILAKRWSGSFLTLNTPAFLPDPDVCSQFLALEQVRKVFDRLIKADLALVGVGNLENSVFLERNVLKPADIELLKQSGAIGEILGRFYDAAGYECDTHYRARVISMGLDELRRVDRVVGVVGGSDRTDAICGAIRGGILKSLVIDDVAARALLEAAG